MSDEYLWDRSGPVDPDVEQLERLLEPLCHAPTVRRPKPYAAMVAAAALVLAATGIWRISPAPAPAATGWEISRVEGTVRVGGRDAAVATSLRSGEVVRTVDGRLDLQDDDVGRLELGPDSEMRAAATGLMLGRGLLHAFIWAPPRQFVLDTPSARAVDLGCEYTIRVDPSGDGLLRVTMGWVAFQFQGRESFIPAEAECVTRRKTGPGIPFYEDAPPAVREGVARFERGDTSALRQILDAARPRDGLTLWHLMTRVVPPDRGVVFDRFAQLVKAPASREAVVRGEAGAIDQCWDALGLENTSWWRGWERRW